MKKITFQVDIHAAKQRVWDIMLHPETYKEWTDSAWPGSFYQGSWIEGQTIDFISENGSGTRAKIEQLSNAETIHAKHIAILLPGRIADTDSAEAKNWIGMTERYRFEDNDDCTKLTVDINTFPEWEPMFSDGWPKALNKLKEICER